ncbi:MAG: trypsin-like peptidase domain-containing protein [Rhodocyclaceae bacterium]|nr:trypsin-like peptidase domain-containing protein [Rhodocyclaceae bacterium]
MNHPIQTLRATDHETARVVAVHRHDGMIVGAGCLVDQRHILTCLHVVQAALSSEEKVRTNEEILNHVLYVSLPGVFGQPTVEAAVTRIGGKEIQNDLALLLIRDTNALQLIEAVEFASPLRHGGKSYSVLGFPGGNKQGRNVVGRLHAADTLGLVQMDRGGALSVLGGFSGSPVWSSDLNAFVGLVVTELAEENVSWCIPSRRLCEFFPELRVRFRVPPKDRPVIHDRYIDDPNKQLFGNAADNGQRRLHATIKKRKKHYVVKVNYECSKGVRPRGHFVTFITYPDFKKKNVDAYELFAEIQQYEGMWRAIQEFYPNELFTIAAIGDGGDTVLTLDLDLLLRTTS